MTGAKLSGSVAGVPVASTSSERSRRHRERLAQGEQPLLTPCLACGRQIPRRLQSEVRAQAAEAVLCSTCWRKSPAGKAADAERKRLARAKAKREQQG